MQQLISNKLLIGIIIFLVFIMGITGWYWRSLRQSPSLSPEAISPSITFTPDPTENWPTYTSTAYKFSIKYPPNWKVGVGDGQQLIYFYPSPFTIKDTKGLSFLPPHISVGIKDIPFSNTPSGNVEVSGELIIKNWQVIQVGNNTAHMYSNAKCTGRCPTKTIDLPYKNGTKTLSFFLTSLSSQELASASAAFNSNIANATEQTLLFMISTLQLTP